MTINHIDQLAQWYADAERATDTNLPRAGDTLIFSSNAGGYAIEVEEDDWTPDIVMPGESARILARAPKPKPAWRGAVAVVASTSDFGIRRVFVKDVDGIWNDALSGRGSFEGNLLDATPLIEAKVTDEMVHAALTAHYGVPFTREDQYSEDEQADMRHALNAALGLEDA